VTDTQIDTFSMTNLTTKLDKPIEEKIAFKINYTWIVGDTTNILVM